jgi:hypothetical protein
MITGTDWITGRQRKVLAYLQDQETVTIDDVIEAFAPAYTEDWEQLMFSEWCKLVVNDLECCGLVHVFYNEREEPLLLHITDEGLDYLGQRQGALAEECAFPGR